MKLLKILRQIIKEQSQKDNIVYLDEYYVSFVTDDSIDKIYFGTDKKQAYSEFESFNDVPENKKNQTTNVTLEVGRFIYKFEPDDIQDTMEDYPIEDYYDDSTLYKLISEPEDYKQLEQREIPSANEKTDDLIYDLENYFDKKVKSSKETDSIQFDKISPSYYRVTVYNNECITLRIKDHTENIYNVDRFSNCDYHISAVVADYDATEKKFGSINKMERTSKEFEFRFTSDNSFKEIVNQIEQALKDIIKKISYDKKIKK